MFNWFIWSAMFFWIFGFVVGIVGSCPWANPKASVPLGNARCLVLALASLLMWLVATAFFAAMMGFLK